MGLGTVSVLSVSSLCIWYARGDSRWRDVVRPCGWRKRPALSLCERPTDADNLSGTYVT